jgi:hypothetical protein
MNIQSSQTYRSQDSKNLSWNIIRKFQKNWLILFRILCTWGASLRSNNVTVNFKARSIWLQVYHWANSLSAVLNLWGLSTVHRLLASWRQYRLYLPQEKNEEWSDRIWVKGGWKSEEVGFGRGFGTSNLSVLHKNWRGNAVWQTNRKSWELRGAFLKWSTY